MRSMNGALASPIPSISIQRGMRRGSKQDFRLGVAQMPSYRQSLSSIQLRYQDHRRQSIGGIPIHCPLTKTIGHPAVWRSHRARSSGERANSDCVELDSSDSRTFRIGSKVGTLIQPSNASGLKADIIHLSWEVAKVATSGLGAAGLPVGVDAQNPRSDLKFRGWAVCSGS
jgi:hypothetical protein